MWRDDETCMFNMVLLLRTGTAVCMRRKATLAGCSQRELRP